MTSLPERILKLAEFDMVRAGAGMCYFQGKHGDPQFIKGAKHENAVMQPLIKSLAEIIEKQSEALNSVRAYSEMFEHPEHELRHAMAVEMPYEIDEVIEFTQARLKELGLSNDEVSGVWG